MVRNAPRKLCPKEGVGTSLPGAATQLVVGSSLAHYGSLPSLSFIRVAEVRSWGVVREKYITPHTHIEELEGEDTTVISRDLGSHASSPHKEQRPTVHTRQHADWIAAGSFGKQNVVAR